MFSLQEMSGEGQLWSCFYINPVLIEGMEVYCVRFGNEIMMIYRAVEHDETRLRIWD